MSKRKVTVIVIAVFALCYLCGAFLIVSVTGYNGNTKYIEKMNIVPVGAEAPLFSYDGGKGRYEFTADGGEFKILQLTDTHLGGGIFTKGLDRKVLDGIYKLVTSVRPRLIIVTGDVVYPLAAQTASINNRKTIMQLAMLFEKLRVPWTVTLGNHEAPTYAVWNREQLADYLASSQLKYCVFTKNPADVKISGYGNQIINIRNADGTINNSLVLFDSHNKADGSILQYDAVHGDQIEWYKREITALSTPENGCAEGEKISSLAFFHIPLSEYRDALRLYEEGSGQVEYLYGVCDEKILCPYGGKNPDKDILFEEMVKLGSTKATFCGHNHMNNFAIVYKGIQLTFGNSMVYTGLHNIGKKDDYRGGTLITLSGKNNFKSEGIFLRDL